MCVYIFICVCVFTSLLHESIYIFIHTKLHPKQGHSRMLYAQLETKMAEVAVSPGKAGECLERERRPDHRGTLPVPAKSLAFTPNETFAQGVT